MKNGTRQLLNLILAACCLVHASCSMAKGIVFSPVETSFVASTPADDPVRSIFGIPAEKKLDFIRWSLELNENKTFRLFLAYGESQPNTNGFKGGGEKLSVSGNYTIDGDIYRLNGSELSAPLSLIKLNEDLLHLLTTDGKLMIGNGGWSYTLNKKDSARNSALRRSAVPAENIRETVYDGRTPCAEIAREYGLQVSETCLKIKWRLTLYRDAVTGEPTTYTLRWIQYDPNLIEGRWRIRKSSDAAICQLELNQTGETLSFLVGDENVLFFLDKSDRLLPGNSDFSFTLNRRR